MLWEKALYAVLWGSSWWRPEKTLVRDQLESALSGLGKLYGVSCWAEYCLWAESLNKSVLSRRSVWWCLKLWLEMNQHSYLSGQRWDIPTVFMVFLCLTHDHTVPLWVPNCHSHRCLCVMLMLCGNVYVQLENTKGLIRRSWKELKCPSAKTWM